MPPGDAEQHYLECQTGFKLPNEDTQLRLECDQATLTLNYPDEASLPPCLDK